MKKEKFFEEWKEDWRTRREEFAVNQAYIFRDIRDRKNLEMRLERRMSSILLQVPEGVANLSNSNS